MKAQIQKWGNSLALRIPKSFATEAKIEQGSTVELSLRQGKLVVAPLSDAAFSLEDLLSKITKRNLHGEIETGRPVGKEAW